MGMVERRNCTGLALEASPRACFIRSMEGKDFNRDDTIQPGVTSAIDSPIPCAQQDRNISATLNDGTPSAF